MKSGSWMVRFLAMVVLSGIILGGGHQLSAATGLKPDSALKPIQYTVYLNYPGQPSTPDNKISKLIEKEFGIHLEYEFANGVNEQQIGVMIAGNDYPDIITGDKRLINAGVLIPLEDLIDKYAPNLKRHYAPYRNKVKDPGDGHIYILANFGRFYGNYRPTTYMGPSFWIQKAVLKEFGYPKVKTLDQYFNLINRYKKKYPEINGMPTIGFEILCDGRRNFCLKNPPQHLIGHPNDGNVVVDYRGKTYHAEIFADKDYARRYYKKLNEMNALGLIDQETFLETYEQYLAKMSSGRALGTFDQLWDFNRANDALIMKKQYERTYAPCPVVFDAGTRDWYADRVVLNINSGFAITKSCKDPVRFIKFLDALLTEKWQKILNWGIQGEDYSVDAKGVFYFTPEQRVHKYDRSWRLRSREETLWSNAPKMEGTFKDGNACSPGDQPGEFYECLLPFDKKFLAAYQYKTWADFYSPPPPNPICYPAWQINLINGSPAKIANFKLNGISSKYLPMVILAKPEDFDKIWNEYVTELHKVNIKAYEDRINEQIQWRLKNWGG
jgi:putative aldouronate transport system substrate-binding protein